jgi:hypothetical protein
VRERCLSKPESSSDTQIGQCGNQAIQTSSDEEEGKEGESGGPAVCGNHNNYQARIDRYPNGNGREIAPATANVIHETHDAPDQSHAQRDG